MNTIVTRTACVAAIVAGAGCVSRAESTIALSGPACPSDDPRWVLPVSGESRSLRVWFDAPAQRYDGWAPYGWRRLRFVMDEWNALRLPLRLIRSTSAREADVTVDVLDQMPGQGDDWDQAGITSITHQAGVITRARVFIAVATPDGQRYSVADQQSNLIHELGHALGLKHAPETGALMAIRRVATELTGADFALARRHFACASGGT